MQQPIGDAGAKHTGMSIAGRDVRALRMSLGFSGEKPPGSLIGTREERYAFPGTEIR
jgi:hypothetical protein